MNSGSKISFCWGSVNAQVVVVVVVVGCVRYSWSQVSAFSCYPKNLPLTQNRVLHTPVGAAIEWAIVRRFSDRLASRMWLIKSENKVLVNRLIATSSKITKISWWEMLVNYQWNWCWLSWQITCLTFTCKHVQFEWLRWLHPANEAWIPSKFSSTN